MTVSILDSFTWSGVDTPPASFSPSAGTDRVAYVALFVSSGTSAAPPTGVTLGGQSMSKVVEAEDSAADRDIATTVWMLNDAGIQAMSGTSIVISGGSYTNITGATFSVSGADQTVPSSTGSLIKFGSAGVQETISLARAAGGYTVAATCIDITEAPSTASNNPSLDLTEQSFTNGTAELGFEASTAETVNFEYTPASSRDLALTVFNVSQAASAIPGISSKTLQREGVAVAASTASVFVWSGHSVDLDSSAAEYKDLTATLTSGVLGDVDLSSTSIGVSDNITVVVLPSSGGPGIVVETTAEDIL